MRAGGGVTVFGFLIPSVGSLHEHMVIPPKIKQTTRKIRLIGQPFFIQNKLTTIPSINTTPVAGSGTAATATAELASNP